MGWLSNSADVVQSPLGSPCVCSQLQLDKSFCWSWLSCWMFGWFCAGCLGHIPSLLWSFTIDRLPLVCIHGSRIPKEEMDSHKHFSKLPFEYNWTLYWPKEVRCLCQEWALKTNLIFTLTLSPLWHIVRCSWKRHPLPLLGWKMTFQSETSQSWHCNSWVSLTCLISVVLETIDYLILNTTLLTITVIKNYSIPLKEAKDTFL